MHLTDEGSHQEQVEGQCPVSPTTRLLLFYKWVVQRILPLQAFFYSAKNCFFSSLFLGATTGCLFPTKMRGGTFIRTRFQVFARAPEPDVYSRRSELPRIKCCLLFKLFSLHPKFVFICKERLLLFLYFGLKLFYDHCVTEKKAVILLSENRTGERNFSLKIRIFLFQRVDG